MSKRFLWLCISVLMLSNIYFVNYALKASFTNLTFSELLLGKILNQGIHWLIILYLIVKHYWEFNNSKVHLVVLVFLLDIVNEAVYYLPSYRNYIAFIDSTFVSFERLGWITIFILLGGKIWVNEKRKQLLTGIVFIILCLLYVYMMAFQNTIQPFYKVFIGCFMLLLFVFFVFGMNTKKTIWHEYTLGAVLIILGDLAFIHAEFYFGTHWRYLYVIPKILINSGELIFVYNLLLRYQYFNHTRL